MLRTIVVLLTTGVLALSTAAAPSMSLKATSGKPAVWTAQSGGWNAVSDSVSLSYGDSVFVDNQQTATVYLGREATLLVRGVTRLSLQGKDMDLTVSLVEGQMFLKRSQPYEFSFFSASARGVVFVPVGTAAAIKLTKLGEPSVAVLEGKVRAESLRGGAALVEAGQYATLEQSGTFKQAALAKETIAALEEWSGTKYQGPVLAEASTEAAATAAPTAAAGEGTSAGVGAGAAAGPGAAATAGATEQPAQPQAAPTEGAPAGKEPSAQAPAEGEKTAESAKGPWKPTFEIGAGVVTVGDEQWTRLALGMDVPFWKFGIFFDVEMFFDAQGRLSNKGWQFDHDTWYRSLLRKIRYVRFGREGDAFFAKFGGLNSVTMGYGFVVDRFTNMLHYPDEKLLGLQMELNDVGTIGVTFQGLVGDFYDFKNDGGVMAARLGFKFLKATEVPVLKDLLIAGQYAVDRNMYAPARNWVPSFGPAWDRDNDRLTDANWLQSEFAGYSERDSILQVFRDAGNYDTLVDTTAADAERRAARSHAMFQLVGGDVSLPLINGKVVRLDLYGQAASRVDKVRGWGFGAPGLDLKAGPVWARAEYRHVQGLFQPGFFGTYYLDERLERYPVVHTKLDSLSDLNLNGVFGILGVNIAEVLIVTGTYQYLVGPTDKGDTLRDKRTDQRYEATAGIGKKITDHIPKFKKLEGYISKSNVKAEPKYNTDGSIRTTGTGSDAKVVYDDFFDKTPYLYWGYRIGFEITKGASLVWDSRHGYRYKSRTDKRLGDNNTMSIQTVITF